MLDGERLAAYLWRQFYGEERSLEDLVSETHLRYDVVIDLIRAEENRQTRKRDGKKCDS